MNLSMITSTATGLGFQYKRAYRQKNRIKLYDALHHRVCKCCGRQYTVSPVGPCLRKLQKALGSKYIVSSAKSDDGYGKWSIFVQLKD